MGVIQKGDPAETPGGVTDTQPPRLHPLHYITFEDPRCYDKKNLNVQQTLVTQYADFESRISPAENRLTLQSIDLLKCFKRARTRKLTTYAFL